MSEPKNALGQYFTPLAIAELMASMIQTNNNSTVLEPSSGKGVFLDVLHDLGFQNVLAVELDPKLASHSFFPVTNASFVSWTPPHSFDCVIGNPPYIRWKNLEDEQRSEISKNRHWGTLFNSLSDYLMIFIVNAIDCLKEGGELIFITPSFWLHTQHAAPVREFMLQQGGFTHLVTFGEAEVFPGVASAIVIFRYTKGSHQPHDIKHFSYIGPKKVGVSGVALLNDNDFEQSTIPQFKTRKNWTIATQETQIAIEKIEDWAAEIYTPKDLFGDAHYSTLGESCDIANGMVSGLDKAFRISPELLQKLNPLESKSVRKVIKAADLARLTTEKSSFYIDLPVGLTEKQIQTMYPNLYLHFLPYVDDLMNRYKYVNSLPFWEWSFRRSESFFTNGRRKVFVPCKERITSREHIRFTLIEGDSIATQDVTAICPKGSTRESVEYIAAYLTLPELSKWIRIKGLIKGGIAEFSERPTASIPFRGIDWENKKEVSIHNRITSIVDEVLLRETQIEFGLHDIHACFTQLGLPKI